MTRAAVRLFFGVVTLVATWSVHAATLRISLEVDARDVMHGIQHVHLSFPEWQQHEFFESPIVHQPCGLDRCGIRLRAREESRRPRRCESRRHAARA